MFVLLTDFIDDLWQFHTWCFLLQDPFNEDDWESYAKFTELGLVQVSFKGVRSSKDSPVDPQPQKHSL